MAGLSDGTKLVAAMNSVLSGNGQGVPAPVPARHHVVRIFDTATGKMAKQLAAPWVAETQNLGMDRYRVNGAVGMTEQLVALAAIEVQGPRQLLSLTVWDIASGRVKKAVLTDADPAVVLTSLSIAPDGRFVAIGGQHADRPGSSTTVGKIWLWRLDD
jgi:hypothetical protein